MSGCITIFAPAHKIGSAIALETLPVSPPDNTFSLEVDGFCKYHLHKHFGMCCLKTCKILPDFA